MGVRRPLPVNEPPVPLPMPSITGPKPRLSICITCLNDNKEIPGTVQSIRETAGDKVEIIVVDDHSDTPVAADGIDKVVRNKSRAGVARSRDIAAAHATNDYILLTDAHMRFYPQWHDSIMARIGDPMQAWCGQCVAMHEHDMDINVPNRGLYHGARLVFLDEPPKQPPVIFEGKWAGSRKEDDYEISCFMGASYFINRDYYFKIGGLGALKHWGSDEPYLSTKIYLSGGSIRLCKSVQIGHQFRTSMQVPYRSNAWCLLYNKLRAMKELLPPDTYRFMLSKFKPSNNLSMAAMNIQKDEQAIAAQRERNGQLFVRDIGWLCDKFRLNNPIHAAHHKAS